MMLLEHLNEALRYGTQSNLDIPNLPGTQLYPFTHFHKIFAGYLYRIHFQPFLCSRYPLSMRAVTEASRLPGNEGKTEQGRGRGGAVVTSSAGPIKTEIFADQPIRAQRFSLSDQSTR